MNCIEIVKKHLVENGFDGLQNDAECGCELSDLVPCGNDFSMCTPGYKHPGNGDFDFVISAERYSGEE